MLKTVAQFRSSAYVQRDKTAFSISDEHRVVAADAQNIIESAQRDLDADLQSAEIENDVEGDVEEESSSEQDLRTLKYAAAPIQPCERESWTVFCGEQHTSKVAISIAFEVIEDVTFADDERFSRQASEPEAVFC